MVNFHICPVCGYNMEVPPCDYNICSSCGTEFGHPDLQVAELREAWLATGPRWWSQYEQPPKAWDGNIQLLRMQVLNSPAQPQGQQYAIASNNSVDYPQYGATWTKRGRRQHRAIFDFDLGPAYAG
jgi:hypothetical protein